MRTDRAIQPDDAAGGTRHVYGTRKRLLLRGFIVTDFAAKLDDFLREAGEWVRSGRLKYREDIVEGLENAPAAFLGLLQGKNFGKLLRSECRQIRLR